MVMSGMLSGLAVLVEKRERRMELGLFVLSHSLHVAYNLLVDYRWVAYHPTLLYPLLALSFTVLLTAFQADNAKSSSNASSHLLRPSYASLFAYFVGKRRQQSAMQQHDKAATVSASTESNNK